VRLSLYLARLSRSRRGAVPRAQRARGVSRHAGGGAQGEQGAHRRHTGHHGPDQRGRPQHSRDREGGRVGDTKIRCMIAESCFGKCFAVACEFCVSLNHSE